MRSDKKLGKKKKLGLCYATFIILTCQGAEILSPTGFLFRLKHIKRYNLDS